MSMVRALVEPHSHFPWDSQTYSLRNQSILDAGQHMVHKALDNVRFSGKGAFVIVDYGTYNGTASMKIIQASIEKIKQMYGPKQQIQVIYEDQPINDFNSLFKRIHGLCPKSTNWLMKNNNVFVTACGTSFYEQCLPDQSVHLGLCFTSAHWLSEKLKLEGSVESPTLRDKQVLKETGKKDWTNHLLNRAKELVPGGHIVFGVNVEPVANANNTKKETSFQDSYSLFFVWKTLLEDRIITEHEFNNVASYKASYVRSAEEWLSPIKDSILEEAGLRIVSKEQIEIHCPYNSMLQKQSLNGGSGMSDDFWNEYMASLRYWKNGTYHSALDDSHSEEKKREIVDELFNRYQSLLVKYPERCNIHTWPMLYVHLMKARVTP